MSFWGGFVEGFSKTGAELIKADVARTDKIVDDTVKIGVSKALEVNEEIKKDKKKIRDELEMLTGVGFSLPKAASIAKAGLSSTMAKLALDTDYKGRADQLWDGTTKFAQDNKLTVQDVVDKLSYQPPLDYSNLNVATPKGSLLGALGLAPEIDTRIQEGITSRVGKLDTGVDRSDINILPGSIPLEARKQFDTKTKLTISQTINELVAEKNLKGGLSPEKQKQLNDLLVIQNPKLDKILALQNIMGKTGENKIGGVNIMTEQKLKELAKKAKAGDKNAEDTVEAYLLNLAKTDKLKAKNLANGLGISITEGM